MSFNNFICVLLMRANAEEFVCRRPADAIPPSREASNARPKLNVKHLGWRLWDFVFFFVCVLN